MSAVDVVEIVERDPQTDSYGSRSDYSSKVASWSTRPKMDVVCVIDLINHVNLCDRKKAFDEVKNFCASTNNVSMQHIQVCSRD